MSTAPEERLCASVRTKRSESVPLEESENEGRQYRTLLSLFASHANAFLKAHRDCLLPTEPYPKIKASREEQQAVNDQLERVYQKMEDKVAKDSLNRNAPARRSIEEYAEVYANAFPEWRAVLSSLQEAKREENEPEELPSKPSFSERKRTALTPPRRPLSSKEPKNGRPNLFGQIYNQFRSNPSSQTYKSKTITAQANEPPDKQATLKLSRMPSRTKKTLLTQKNRYEQMQSEKRKQYQQFLFNAEDPECEAPAPGSRPSAKRLINLKFTQRKSIMQLQKLQVQNRIMMISSVLSVNLVQPQGYRARSRCWQNYFN